MSYPPRWQKASWVWRDLVSIASVAIALLLARWLDLHAVGAPVSLFLCAIMVSAWFGGTRSAVSAVALSLIAFDFYFVTPLFSLKVAANEVPRTLIFALSALFVGGLSAAQRGTTESLRRTRDDLIAENEERERAEAALRDAQTELARVARLTTMGELSASLSHELRQPLAAIVMNASAAVRWLDREPPNLQEARDAARRIVGDGKRADEVIVGLRALAKNVGPQLTTLDIDGVVQEVLVLTRGELRRHGVTLRTDLTTSARRILGDRVQLQQVLLNLIVNGIDAMKTLTGRGRELIVSSAFSEPDNLLVSVEDTGTGVDAAIAHRVFEPFFTTKADGLGMGLSICRSIVEAHGGRLWVTPRASQGTAVCFTVPVASEHASGSMGSLSHLAASRG
jgi:C4-dicarboxylate-specific signal transduction histidine kinase